MMGMLGDGSQTGLLALKRENYPLRQILLMNICHGNKTDMLVRCYSQVIDGSEIKKPISISYKKRETPLGRPTYTYAEVLYVNKEKGKYMLLWKRLGRHKPEFLNYTGKKECLIYPCGTNSAGIPILVIIAIEGVGPNDFTM